MGTPELEGSLGTRHSPMASPSSHRLVGTTKFTCSRNRSLMSQEKPRNHHSMESFNWFPMANSCMVQEGEVITKVPVVVLAVLLLMAPLARQELP